MRVFLLLLVAGLCWGTQPELSIRGKLVQRDGVPYLDSAGKLVTLEGEPETMQVLRDARLKGEDLEIIGHYTAPAKFAVGPFYESKSNFVHKGGKKYTISYWFEVCSIRT
jgi:hypothetical protein